MKSYPILIDPEFRALIPPLSADERMQLKENLREHGLLDGLSLWHRLDGTNVLIDGHHRYDIIKELAESENTEERAQWSSRLEYFDYFCRVRLEEASSDREAVKLWILEHQVGRRNLTKQKRIEMVARIVLMRQEQTAKIQRANLKQSDKSSPASATTLPNTLDAPKVPEGTKKAPSAKLNGKTVPAAAKEFGVPRKALQEGVNKLKGKPAVIKRSAPTPKTPSPVATAATTLSEKFYVIRRKKDGLFQKRSTKFVAFNEENIPHIRFVRVNDYALYAGKLPKTQELVLISVSYTLPPAPNGFKIAPEGPK